MIEKKSREEMQGKVDIWDVACKSQAKLIPGIKDNIIVALLNGDTEVQEKLQAPKNDIEKEILKNIITLIRQDLLLLAGIKDITTEEEDGVITITIPLKPIVEVSKSTIAAEE